MFRSAINNDETDENYLLALNDQPLIMFDGMQASDDEIRNTKFIISSHISLIKEIYVHLQGKTNSYPFLDHYTIRKHFIEKMGLANNAFDKASYGTILAKADFSSQ